VQIGERLGFTFVSEHHYITAFGYAVGAGGRPPDALASMMESMELCGYT
jgi:hypothetical protein